jgi:transcriptional regulator with XRE-family HTH domain
MPDETAGPIASNPGDLGRRVALRRRQLGLSPSEVEARAGLAAGYVAYLEQQPAELTGGSVLRLAAALDTTASELLGGGIDLPPGRDDAGRRPELAELDAQECRVLLSTHGVGRVGLYGRSGPVILPVNYTVVDDAFVVRTAPDTVLATAAAGDGVEVAFEVDHLDEATSQGWSVLVVGRARIVTEAGELQRLSGQVHGRPWAGGQRDIHIRIEALRITGRRILTH